MRMWMVPVWIMCGAHRSGEHNEIHKHRHNFEKGHSMDGRIANNCLEPLAMQRRHDELAETLNHRSPYTMPPLDYLPPEQRTHRVNVYENLMTLYHKCPACRALIDAEFETLQKESPG